MPDKTFGPYIMSHFSSGGAFASGCNIQIVLEASIIAALVQPLRESFAIFLESSHNINRINCVHVYIYFSVAFQLISRTDNLLGRGYF